MFKILLILSLSLMTFTYAANEQLLIRCSPQLTQCVLKIQQVPEAVQLIKEIQKRGEIRIEVNNNEALSQQFGAFWDTDRRIISVNQDWNESEGRMIASILFELHNASVDAKLNELDFLAATGRINRETYIRSFEHLEFINSKKTEWIANKGIAMGVFPESARPMTYRDFDEHYYYQQYGGHSAYIGMNYDQLVRLNPRRA